MTTIRWLGNRLRQWTCPHEKRVREAVYRPQGSARRRERYSCPECHLVWTEEARALSGPRPPYTTPS